MKKIRNLKEDMQKWAYEQSQSSAKTKKGIEKAAAKWSEGKDVLSLYLYDAHNAALAEDQHRIVVAAERKSIRQHPVYARYYLAKTQEVKKIYEAKKGSKEKAEYVEKEISNLAYRKIFGNSSLRKTYNGINSLHAGCRTTDNGKCGWNRVVWHYADYSAILSPDSLRIYVDYGNGYKEYQIATNGSCVIGDRKIRKSIEKETIILKPHHLRKLYERVLRGKNIVWRWNMAEKKGEYIHVTSGERYHTPCHVSIQPYKIFKVAVIAFKKRRDEKKEDKQRQIAEQMLIAHAELYYADMQDSKKAGNCETLTRDYAQHIFQKIGAQGECAVRCDIILADRDDSYTRRACIYAVMHH